MPSQLVERAEAALSAYGRERRRNGELVHRLQQMHNEQVWSVDTLELKRRYHELQHSHMMMQQMATDETSFQGKAAVYRQTIKTQARLRKRIKSNRVLRFGEQSQLKGQGSEKGPVKQRVGLRQTRPPKKAGRRSIVSPNIKTQAQRRQGSKPGGGEGHGARGASKQARAASKQARGALKWVWQAPNQA
eukprot:360863-Chlamydomonas_euryale.AAC.4